MSDLLLLQSLDDIGMLLDRDEEEIRMVMLDRIDADKDERLSFEEFLILFEEEQRKVRMMKKIHNNHLSSFL
jgi:hypothetical protein